MFLCNPYLTKHGMAWNTGKGHPRNGSPFQRSQATLLRHHKIGLNILSRFVFSSARLPGPDQRAEASPPPACHRIGQHRPGAGIPLAGQISNADGGCHLPRHAAEAVPSLSQQMAEGEEGRASDEGNIRIHRHSHARIQTRHCILSISAYFGGVESSHQT